ncbi:hypothetical protein GN316_15135 [Xylophilus sp. Kf1]|nr:hypothetical protein [Xylophilus sp. Kf1]
MHQKGLRMRPIAFTFGAVVSVCIGMLALRSGELLIANILPLLAAICLGGLCVAFKTVHLSNNLGWGVFVGALIFWMPITLANYLFPLIFVPVLGVYAALVPLSASFMSKAIKRLNRS